MDFVGVRKMRLKDKIAFITGAGMGIGRATCLLFAKEGARIIAADIDKKAGDETVALIKNRGGKGIFESSYITGQEIIVDGGLMVKGR